MSPNPNRRQVAQGGRIDTSEGTRGTPKYCVFNAATLKGKESGRIGRPASFPVFMVKWPDGGRLRPVRPDWIGGGTLRGREDAPGSAVLEDIFTPWRPRARARAPRRDHGARIELARNHTSSPHHGGNIHRAAPRCIPHSSLNSGFSACLAPVFLGPRPGAISAPVTYQWPGLRPAQLLTFRRRCLDGHAVPGRLTHAERQPNGRGIGSDSAISCRRFRQESVTGGAGGRAGRICGRAAGIRGLTSTPPTFFLREDPKFFTNHARGANKKGARNGAPNWNGRRSIFGAVLEQPGRVHARPQRVNGYGFVGPEPWHVVRAGYGVSEQHSEHFILGTLGGLLIHDRFPFRGCLPDGTQTVAPIFEAENPQRIATRCGNRNNPLTSV